jgi:hypothetical protein
MIRSLDEYRSPSNPGIVRSACRSYLPQDALLRSGVAMPQRWREGHLTRGRRKDSL